MEVVVEVAVKSVQASMINLYYIKNKVRVLYMRFMCKILWRHIVPKLEPQHTTFTCTRCMHTCEVNPDDDYRRYPIWMRRVGFVPYDSNKFRWYGPAQQLFYRIWFAPFRWLRHYNMKDCKCSYPDWVGGHGTKVRPLLGYVVYIEEGSMFKLKWWQDVKKYELKI